MSISPDIKFAQPVTSVRTRFFRPLAIDPPSAIRQSAHAMTLAPRTSFQDMILTLHDFWAAQGCLILQPYDMRMGAGTFHPATTLRALGPEPWNAAFVQPCRRPTDGRYGENPNRLQHYYQYQVILKPSPPDIQDLYLESLRTIGIDPLAHDIRFVEDDWESPTLGAWGLGWEVWCDGMEVTQFTYFQQMGGYDCKPVAGELTYGLERLAMYIQGVDNVYDLEFNGSRHQLWRRVPRKRKTDVEMELRGRRNRRAVRPVQQGGGGMPQRARRAGSRSRPMNRRSKPATSSTCCRRAASSACRNAPAIWAASAIWRADRAKRMWRRNRRAGREISGVVPVTTPTPIISAKAGISFDRSLHLRQIPAFAGMTVWMTDFLLELRSEEIPARMQKGARGGTGQSCSRAKWMPPGSNMAKSPSGPRRAASP